MGLFSLQKNSLQKSNYTEKILIIAGIGMILSVADLITTRTAINQGSWEANPLMVNIVQSDLAFFALRGMALVMICLSLWLLQYESKESKRSLKSYFPHIAYILIMPWMCAVLWNLCVLWRII